MNSTGVRHIAGLAAFGTAAVLIALTCGATVLAHSEASRDSNPSGSTVSGTIVTSWRDAKGARHEVGLSMPLPVRLCSVERVFETQPDNLGRFRFRDIPPGTYELSTGQLIKPPRTMKGIEIKEGATDPVFVRMDFDDPRIMNMEDADCFRDTPGPSNQDCERSWFKIEYGPWSTGRTASIKGRVANTGGRKSKGLAKAQITLQKHGDSGVRYETTTDRRGAFQLSPEPGVYDLSASLPGFAGIKIEKFLVPRENDTKLLLLTSSKDQIILCQ